jgi:hypothetical protein
MREKNKDSLAWIPRTAISHGSRRAEDREKSISDPLWQEHSATRVSIILPPLAGKHWHFHASLPINLDAECLREFHRNEKNYDWPLPVGN